MLRGAIRGAVATVVMTGVYALRRELPLPPQVLSDNAQRAVGLEPVVPWWVTHLAVGMTLGAVAEELEIERKIPFGVAVWVASYGTALPALGLYPRPDRDDRIRAATGVAAHVVFGAVL
jgi:hypothetical protein